MSVKKSGAVPRDLVVAAYRAILGREPENEDVVNDKMAHCESEEALLKSFVTSPEFLQRQPSYAATVASQYHARQDHIDLSVPNEVFERLFSRIKEQWTALGRAEPFWSVLADDRFRMKSIERFEEEFYATGAASDRLIDTFCQRALVTPPTGICLELGCGVGRITRFLAQRFDRVLAVDISRGNLQLAQRLLQNEHIDNVGWLLLDSLEQLQELDEFDFFFSLIVLQHNPPPVIARMLQTLLHKLRRGGGFLFQVPTQPPGYSFDTADYLQRPNAVGASFEMHALPMHAVLDIIADAGGRVKEVVSDNWTGALGSHTFFGTKP